MSILDTKLTRRTLLKVTAGVAASVALGPVLITDAEEVRRQYWQLNQTSLELARERRLRSAAERHGAIRYQWERWDKGRQLWVFDMAEFVEISLPGGQSRRVCVTPGMTEFTLTVERSTKPGPQIARHYVNDERVHGLRIVESPAAGQVLAGAVYHAFRGGAR